MRIVVRVGGIVPTPLDLSHAGTREQQLGLNLGSVLVYLNSAVTAGAAGKSTRHPRGRADEPRHFRGHHRNGHHPHRGRHDSALSTQTGGGGDEAISCPDSRLEAANGSELSGAAP
jgi:hypothetical protein